MQAVWGVKVRILATVLEYQRVHHECISPQKDFVFSLYMQGKVRILATGKGWKSGLNMNASSLHKRLEAVTY